jgi:lipid-A-disaccharide synthase
MPKKILIVSGEPSGDLHASNLVKDIKTLRPDTEFFGMGGSLSKSAGVDIIFDIKGLALVGVVEVAKKIFTVGKAYKSIVAALERSRPDLAVLVDYPGFNLRLARELKKRSIPVVYYISPQVWAWGRDRVNIIKRCVKKIIVFFKFEEELYRTYDIDSAFVGHPLVDSVKVTSSREDILKKYRIADTKGPVVALLPGSRELEVRNLLPAMVGSARMISKKIQGAKFVIVKYPDLHIDLYEYAFKHTDIDIRLANGDAYNVLSVSDLAIVASGTATLESAIVGTPIIITYKTSFITYLLYKMVSKIKFVGLVNIIAGREVAPELLQYSAKPAKIAASALDILSDGKKTLSIKKELESVKSYLGSPGASKRAAGIVVSVLGSLNNH